MKLLLSINSVLFMQEEKAKKKEEKRAKNLLFRIFICTLAAGNQMLNA